MHGPVNTAAVAPGDDSGEARMHSWSGGMYCVHVTRQIVAYEITCLTIYIYMYIIRKKGNEEGSDRNNYTFYYFCLSLSLSLCVCMRTAVCVCRVRQQYDKKIYSFKARKQITSSALCVHVKILQYAYVVDTFFFSHDIHHQRYMCICVYKVHGMKIGQRQLTSYFFNDMYILRARFMCINTVMETKTCHDKSQ